MALTPPEPTSPHLSTTVGTDTLSGDARDRGHRFSVHPPRHGSSHGVAFQEYIFAEVVIKGTLVRYEQFLHNNVVFIDTLGRDIIVRSDISTKRRAISLPMSIKHNLTTKGDIIAIRKEDISVPSITDTAMLVYEDASVFLVKGELGVDYGLKVLPITIEVKTAYNAFVAMLHSLDGHTPLSRPKEITKTTIDTLVEKFPRPTLEEIGFLIKESTWFYILLSLRRGKNILIIGPTGCGKTELVTHVTERYLGSKDLLSIFDMGGTYDPISTLLGNNKLVRDRKADSVISKFEQSRFSLTIQDKGIVLLDELNRAPANTNNLLFPCLDNRRKLFVEMAPADKQVIDVHEECFFIATANIGTEYSGTNVIDRALLDRFPTVIELDYPTIEEEVDIVINKVRLERLITTKLVTAVDKIRSAYKRGELSNSVSTRTVIHIAELVKDGLPPLDALELSILPLFEGNLEDGEKTTVKTIIATL